MKKIYKYLLSLIVLTSLATAVTITTTESMYTQAKSVKVNIEGALSGNQDWVGLYRVGTSSEWKNVLAWSWVNGNKSNLGMDSILDNIIENELKLSDGGDYEVRLFFNNSYQVEASAKFYATQPYPTLFVTYPEINIGDKQTVLVNTLLSGDKDWVGIYPKGSDNSWDNVIAWNWATYGDVSLNKIKKEMPVGEYDIRLFFHNSFDEEKSTNFYVIAETNTLGTTKATYSENETVSVNVNAVLSGNKDWVGVYPKNSDNSWDNVIAWNWVADKDMVTLNKVKKNMPAGNYEARLFYNNSYTLEAKSGFSVSEIVNNKYPKTTTLTKRPTDNSIHKPTVGNSTVDPVFGTRISMVNKSDTYKSPYPKIQAWNSDMSLIRIGYRLYNAITLEESPITKGLSGGKTYNKLCAPLSSDFRWSTKDPNKFYVLNSSLQLIEGHIIGNSTNCNTILFDFENNGFEQANIGPGEGNIDFNEQYIVFPVKKIGDSKIYIFLYDLKNKRKVWNSPKLYNAVDAHWEANGNYWTPTILDWVSMSPSGKYIVINDSTTGMYRYNINFQDKRRLEYRNSNGEITSQGGHGDIGFDINGNEVFVQFMSGKGVHSFNLDNPDELGKTLLIRANGGGFVSCRNTIHRGWCYVTTRTEGFREIYALKLDGTSNQTVQRFTQTHENWFGGTVSPDGTKVMFSNHWGTNNIDTFIAEVE